MEGFNNNDKDEESLRGQAEILKFSFSYIESMAVKCVVELRIPDIINSYGGPITLAQITSKISDAPSPDIKWLARIMTLLVRSGIFALSKSEGGEELFGLTRSSRWLLRDSPGLTLAPFLLSMNHPDFLSPWYHLSDCVRQGPRCGGGTGAFERSHGKAVWEFLSEKTELNNLFNAGMGCTSEIVVKAALEEYGNAGFSGVKSLVDVGGGTGAAANEIVKRYPHISAINFDLPHVIATAPAYPGVSHVGGDVFESVPNADAILMKWFIHNWTDEECVKILKNCRKAIPKSSGKVIIVDIVFEPRDESLFSDAAVMIDLVLGALTRGRARTETEWKYVLKEAGFSTYKLTHILTTFASIIEAYPD